jgi:hypothetical protein
MPLLPVGCVTRILLLSKRWIPIPILPFVVPDELPLPAAAAAERILVHWLELEEEKVILRRRMMMSVLCSK